MIPLIPCFCEGFVIHMRVKKLLHIHVDILGCFCFVVLCTIHPERFNSDFTYKNTYVNNDSFKF